MEVFWLDKKGKMNCSSDMKGLKKTHSSWIRLIDPSEDEIEKVTGFTGIPRGEFDDFLEDEERSRFEEGRFLQIIYRTPFTEGEDITTVSFDMFFMKHTFVTIERTNTYVLERLASLLRSGKRKNLFRKSSGNFIFHIFGQVNDEFQKSIRHIGSVVKNYKINYGSSSEKDLLKLYSANIALSHFNNALIANRDVLNSMRKSRSKYFRKYDLERFEDLYFDVLQIIDTEKIERDVLSTMFNFQGILASYRMNNFMKRLTALALIIAIPTLISSIYGMNVVNLPLAEEQWGFIALLSFMLVVSIGGFYMMKKLEWF
ncbi:MAG: magnesium transporter CorA family protein [Nanobdellota archaeon]